MKILLIAATAATLALGAPAFASGEVDQASKDKITAELTKQGYEVRKIVAENGKVEAYALKDGKKYEVYFDKDMKQTEVKASDD